MLARKTMNPKLFIILYKLTFYGVCVIMACDFLVATLYLNNAVSLITTKISPSLLNKLCFSTWISITIIFVIQMIIDFINISKYFKNTPDSQSAIAYFICITGDWQKDQLKFLMFNYILSLLFDPILMGMLLMSFILIRRFLKSHRDILSKIPKDWFMVAHVSIMILFYISSIIMIRTAIFFASFNNSSQALPTFDSNFKF